MAPLKVLCLHSFRTSGAILQRQLQDFSNFASKLSDIAEFSFLDAPHRCDEAAEQNVDTIQFAQCKHLCWEDDGVATISVVRKGHARQPVTVSFHTENETVPEDQFERLEGSITLNAGQFKTSFELGLADDSDWSVEKRQWVVLDEALIMTTHTHSHAARMCSIAIVMRC